MVMKGSHGVKICIDIQSVISHQTGVARYTFELVKALSEITEKTDIVLSYFDFLNRFNGLEYFINKPIKIMPGRLYNQLWKKFHFPPYNWLSGNYDIYHFPNFCLPPMSKGKFIITIHDTAFMRYPEYIEPKNLAFLKQELEGSIGKASKIITVSDFTKSEIINYFGTNSEKIKVIYEGIDKDFKKVETKKLDLPELYILFVGTLEPRKNIEGLIRSFSIQRQKGYKLVVAGEKGWFYEGIFKLVKEQGLDEEVIFLGYVPQEDLPEVYSRAKAFVFPSFYEGFGFPPLEAMACGVPVVSTKFETLGDAARFIDPKSPEDMANGIKDVLANPGTWIEKGKEHVKRFTWERTAGETLELYKAVANDK
jgi:glycosyltransferase involved in cell wall biosynthesis